MPLFVLYLLKLSISLSIVWIFYQLLLRRLTFYTMNRWYLLGYSLLSFFIPLIDIGRVLENGLSRPSVVIQFIPSIGDYGVAAVPAEVHPSFWDGWNLLLVLLVVGSGILCVRLAIRCYSLRKIRRQARLIGDTAIRIYQVDEAIIPFSFGNAVYINQQLHTEKEWEEIILHEYVHIRQRHTVDILFSELFCILNWYNPAAWLIRHSIRQNLEFIADQQVLENGFDKKSYQYHLLKVVGEPRYQLANSFNFSSLRKRIIMMNKIRSARLHLLRFLFILPLISVLLVAFRDKYEGMFRRPGDVVDNAALKDVLHLATEYGRLPDPVSPVPFISHTGKPAPAPLKTPAAPSTLRVDVPAGGRKDTVHPNAAVILQDSLLSSSLSRGRTVPKGVLFIVDDKKMPEGWNVDSIHADEIESIDVYKDEKSKLLYGERAVAGVVNITTKGYVRRFERMRPIDIGKLMDRPVYIIDGRAATGQLPSDLNPSMIESIQVLKSDSGALRKYGEIGRDGVILIHLKEKPVKLAAPDRG